jgi:hypothetical protein
VLFAYVVHFFTFKIIYFTLPIFACYSNKDMKKILIGLVLSAAFLLLASYIFIPGKMKMEKTITVGAALPGVSRVLTNEANWRKWWPNKTPFIYNGVQYKPGGNAFNVINVNIYAGADTIKSRMELVLLSSDSIMIIWNAEKQTSNNPFKRFSIYRDVKRTQENMTLLLGHIKSFLDKPENIYGFPIRKVMVVDSVLISTRRSFDHKPGEKDIDAMIQSLRKYIAEKNAIEKNRPMLNVMMIDSANYEVMTAIPVNKSLPDTKEFATKFMLKDGNILEVQIQGGPHTIASAFNELENYRADHQYTSPAIPYQLLITDRMKEPDTTKWITRWYYPVL